MGGKVYTPRQVAQLAGVDVTTVYYWINKGELRALKVGERLRIPESYLGDVIKVGTPDGLERYDPAKHGTNLT
ncbi:MAG: helix-turn-helix domain-containing protein [Chloroflexota bacterium]|nr:helix-turn-helix domain-containing protein [Chloroflexota bacterium]